MLPWLNKHKDMSSLIIARRGEAPQGQVAHSEVEAPGHDGLDPDMKTAAEMVIRAMESKSVIDLGHALQAAWEASEKGEGDEPEGDEVEEA